MRLRLWRPALVAAVAVLAATVTFSLGTPAGSVDAQSGPNRLTSAVGALFTRTPSGGIGTHFCTASVVDSPAGDLIVTAAHCMTGRRAGDVVFVPGYSHGQAPFGTWAVKRIIEDQAWTTSADPDDDFAFLIVHQEGTHGGVEKLTGGMAIGVDVPAGQTVEVFGYPDNQDGLISCANVALAFSPTQYQFNCGGFTDGTSGSPLLMNLGVPGGHATVIGVIGGYHQGGYRASVSYAAKFSANFSALYKTALGEAGGLSARLRSGKPECLARLRARGRQPAIQLLSSLCASQS